MEIKWGIAEGYQAMGRLTAARRDYVEARTMHEKYLALLREIGSEMAIAGQLSTIGFIRQGDLVKAQEPGAESVKLCRDMVGKWALDDALGHLGMVAQQQRHYDQAQDCYQESLTLRDEMG